MTSLFTAIFVKILNTAKFALMLWKRFFFFLRKKDGFTSCRSVPDQIQRFLYFICPCNVFIRQIYGWHYLTIRPVARNCWLRLTRELLAAKTKSSFASLSGNLNNKSGVFKHISSPYHTCEIKRTTFTCRFHPHRFTRPRSGCLLYAHFTRTSKNHSKI